MLNSEVTTLPCAEAIVLMGIALQALAIACPATSVK